jgi:hypothetical protein
VWQTDGGSIVNVIVEGREPCLFCGFEVRWIMSTGVRINKRSMRTDGKNIIAQLDHQCPECGRAQMSDMGPLRWVFAPESQVRVDEYREKRGWL